MQVKTAAFTLAAALFVLSHGAVVAAHGGANRTHAHRSQPAAWRERQLRPHLQRVPRNRPEVLSPLGR